MLEEAAQKFFGGEGHTAKPLRSIVAIAESNLASLEGFQPAVGYGDAQDIARQVTQCFVTSTSVERVNDPRLLPDVLGNAREQLGVCQDGFKLGAEDD